MRLTKLVMIFALCAAVSACASVDVKKTAEPSGQAAYDFTLPDQNGKSVTLSSVLKDFRGALIAFYPKDDSRN